VYHKECSSITAGQPAGQGFAWWSWLACCIFCLAEASPARAQKLLLEIEPDWQGAPLLIGRELSGSKVAGISVSRLDGLLSELALQRLDGSWLESGRWHAFVSAEKGRLSAVADGVPAEEFKAIRFRVGLDSETDASDPQTWPADHPLHPDVCGLHWGWKSGYVFLAMEGHWEPGAGTGRITNGLLSPALSSRGGEGEKAGGGEGAKAGRVSGFSYHLAGASKPMMVELPVRFSGGRPTTIRLGMDVAMVLAGGEVLREAASTHSREGDTLAPILKERVARSFRVKSVHNDLYQPPWSFRPQIANFKLPANATSFRLNISERLPKVSLPEDNPLTVEGVELGRRLFHDARLSKGNAQSCATCHDSSRAFTDGRSKSVGASGESGRRNAMPLVNLAWMKEFFWDGRAKSLREQVLMPIQDAHEMNEKLGAAVAKLEADRDYPPQFKAAFGSAGITPERMALALEQFLLTLVSQESKFDRAARKLDRLSAQEQRGLELFITEHDPARGLRGADCFHCHGGNLFSNHQFMNNGLEARPGDLGRMEVTGAEKDRAKFKVPTLRNVALTAPYMHDGRFATLEEVIEHYNGKLHRTRTLDPNLAKHPESGLNMSADDKAALIAFLKTLTDEPAANQFSKTP
jgi:cytochrome c peroxidase